MIKAFEELGDDKLYDDELRLQSRCWQWHWNTYVEDRDYVRMIYQNPRNKIHGSMLKAAGLRKGTADQVWYRPGKPDVYVEYKIGNNKQSEEQYWFQKLMELCGHEYYIVRTLKEYQYLIITLKQT